jgi:putative ABC transport system permease protein
MFHNFLKTAFRNMLRHKGFTSINITGLTLGLSVCLLIGLFVKDEKSFDAGFPQSEQIYRLYYKLTNNEGTNLIATTPPTFTTSLQQNFPEVENTVRVFNLSKQLIGAGDKKLYKEGGIMVDSNFFELFPHTFLHGLPIKTFNDPTSIVISEELAHTYFGNDNPIGKQLLVGKSPTLIKGIFKKNPHFHLKFDYVFTMAGGGLPQTMLGNWGWYGMNSYVKLKRGVDVKELERKFQQFVAPFVKDEVTTSIPFFQPLKEIHLYSSSFKYDIAIRGNITYVNALIVIAVFILLIACFNYVNLATAHALQRAKEVGVRKTIGASKKHLLFQFLGESVLLTFISVTLAAILIYLLLPLLNRFAEKHIVFDLFQNPFTAFFLLGFAMLIGIIAGIYPALFLIHFKPVNVLKGKISDTVQPGKVPWLRHGLVVLQFTLSVILIISAIVVIKQVNFLHNKDLGFSKEQILFFPIKGEQIQKNYETFKAQIRQVKGVTSVSVGYGFPGDNLGDGLISILGRQEKKPIKSTLMMVDEDYIHTLGLRLIAGRDFSKHKSTDKDEAFIINEAAVKDLGFVSPQDALGQTLLWPTWAKQDSLKKGQVIGVVKDFHFKSLYELVEPAVLQIYPNAYSEVAVKISSAGLPGTLAQVKAIWDHYAPGYPLDYNFLDESFDRMYKEDDKLKSLLWIFTAITIFVACLGLFGLVAYTAERRKKEVGIRKVLGASVNGILLLLAKDFLLLIAIALIIASPIAWYFMNEWLQEFAYRIELDGWIFLTASLIAVLIAITTISFQALKAALTNPIQNLRTE